MRKFRLTCKNRMHTVYKDDELLFSYRNADFHSMKNDRKTKVPIMKSFIALLAYRGRILLWLYY